jgi:hypothetical protein
MGDYANPIFAQERLNTNKGGSCEEGVVIEDSTYF